MKLYWRALLLAIVFIVALLIMRHRGSEEDKRQLWNIEPTQLVSIEVTRDKLPLRFEHRDDEWFLKAGESFVPLDEEKWTWRLKPILHLHTESRLDVDSSDPAVKQRYGLKQPQSHLLLVLRNGHEHQIMIGHQTPLQRHYYIQVDDKTGIFLLPVSALAPLLQVETSDVTPSEATESPADIRVEDSLEPGRSPLQ